MEMTKRQKAVLEKIYNFINSHSYPPSVRDVAEIMGFSSPRAASDHIKSLEKKGYIARNSLARSIRLTVKAMNVLLPDSVAGAMNRLPDQVSKNRDVVYNLAILGRIAAGSPVLAQENIEGYIPVPEGFLKSYGADFALRVKGNSMTGDHILEGDIIMVKSRSIAQNGEIIAALVGEEAVVKRFYSLNNSVELRSSNPDYPPIKIDLPEIRQKDCSLPDFKILGKVVAVYRNI
jgi:repressor LexA